MTDHKLKIAILYDAWEEGAAAEEPAEKPAASRKKKAGKATPAQELAVLN